jgi:hypothetical protein
MSIRTLLSMPQKRQRPLTCTGNGHRMKALLVFRRKTRLVGSCLPNTYKLNWCKRSLALDANCPESIKVLWPAEENRMRTEMHQAPWTIKLLWTTGGYWLQPASSRVTCNKVQQQFLAQRIRSKCNVHENGTKRKILHAGALGRMSLHEASRELLDIHHVETCLWHASLSLSIQTRRQIHLHCGVLSTDKAKIVW